MELIFVKLTAIEDQKPLWVNMGAVLGLRALEPGGTCVLTHNGALHVEESMEVIFFLPPIQCWQVPDKGAERSEEMLVEDPPKTE